MPYFNLKKEGKPIAIIKGGTGKENVLYLETNDNDGPCCGKCSAECDITDRCCKKCEGGCFDDMRYDADREQFGGIFGKVTKQLKNGQLPYIKLPNENHMSPIPRIKKDGTDARETIFISGPEESGKSHWAANYATNFKKIYKGSKIFLFSGVAEDPVIDALKPIRVKLDERLYEKPIEIDEFPENSLVIFDDIDTLTDPKIREAVFALRDKILEVGRHKSIFIISITHNPVNNKRTKASLLEASSIVLFPMAGDTFHARRVLKEYCGYDPKNIDPILNLKSRWIQCHKRYPKFILHEMGAMFT